MTGLSVHTVHDHLKSARRKLDAGDSLTAAHMLRTHETPSPQNLGPTESGWSDTSAPRHDGDAEVEKSGSTILPFALKGRPWNDLSLRWRIVWPLLLVGVIALGAGALVSGATVLTQLVLSLQS